jgi:hypothetical protein
MTTELIGKITKDQILKNERKVRRENDIEQGFKPMGNRVHKSKKSYNRKENKNFSD